MRSRPGEPSVHVHTHTLCSWARARARGDDLNRAYGQRLFRAGRVDRLAHGPQAPGGEVLRGVEGDRGRVGEERDVVDVPGLRAYI